MEPGKSACDAVLAPELLSFSEERISCVDSGLQCGVANGVDCGVCPARRLELFGLSQASAALTCESNTCVAPGVPHEVFRFSGFSH